MKQVLVKFILFNAFLFSAFAQADSIAKPRHTAFPWEKKKEFGNCGINCVHERTGENIAQQIITIVRERQELENKRDAIAATAPTDAVKISETTDLYRANIRGYCTPKELAEEPGTKTTKDLLDDCFRRYKDLKKQELQGLRLALAKSQKNQLELYSKDRKVNAPPLDKDQYVLPKTSYFESNQDLSARYADYLKDRKDWAIATKNRTEDLLKISYNEWLDGLPKEPSEDEMKKFKEVQITPDRSVWVEDTSKPVDKVVFAQKKAIQAQLLKDHKAALQGRLEYSAHEALVPTFKEGVGQELLLGFEKARSSLVDTANEEPRQATNLFYELSQLPTPAQMAKLTQTPIRSPAGQKSGPPSKDPKVEKYFNPAFADAALNPNAAVNTNSKIHLSLPNTEGIAVVLSPDDVYEIIENW